MIGGLYEALYTSIVEHQTTSLPRWRPTCSTACSSPTSGMMRRSQRAVRRARGRSALGDGYSSGGSNSSASPDEVSRRGLACDRRRRDAAAPSCCAAAASASARRATSGASSAAARRRFAFLARDARGSATSPDGNRSASATYSRVSARSTVSPRALRAAASRSPERSPGRCLTSPGSPLHSGPGPASGPLCPVANTRCLHLQEAICTRLCSYLENTGTSPTSQTGWSAG